MISDVVWPSLYLTESMSAWLCIAPGVVIEGLIFWRIGKMIWWKALIGAFIANGASTLLGIILLLPMIGIWLEVLANLTYKSWLHLGTFNLLTWILTWLAATLVNTAIEVVSIWMCCLTNWSRRFIISVLIANAVSVAIATAVLFYLPKAIR
jgi:hypothetical protein